MPNEICKVPCKPVADALVNAHEATEKKVGQTIFMWVIGGLVVISGFFLGFSGLLLNSKMKTIQVQIQYINLSMDKIEGRLNRPTSPRGAKFSIGS